MKRVFKTRGYVAIVTTGRAIAEIEIMYWGGLPQTVGCVKNNKCGNALDCMRILNKLLNAHFKWEVM